MKIRCYKREDRNSLIALWQDCGQVIPYSAPARGIERKQQAPLKCFGVVMGKQLIPAP